MQNYLKQENIIKKKSMFSGNISEDAFARLFTAKGAIPSF